MDEAHQDDWRIPMYASYWRLRAGPFENRNDTAFYFPAATHHGALLKLRYVIEQGKGLGLLVGDHGTGKTFLTHVLERDLGEERYAVQRLVYPRLTASELLAYFARALEADVGPHAGPGQNDERLLPALEHRLRALRVEGRHPVFVIDEAHLLEPAHLQTLQLLLNVQQDPGTDLSLLLVGQPELLQRVRRVGGLEARVAVKTALRPLDADECARYVRHRVGRAGGDRPFASETLQAVHELSQGVPRRINQVCDLAMLIGFADQRDELSRVEIEAAADELACVSAE